jgi:hypothetical protein
MKAIVEIAQNERTFPPKDIREDFAHIQMLEMTKSFLNILEVFGEELSKKKISNATNKCKI